MMKKDISSCKKTILSCVGFIAGFLIILSVLTLIYLPKWKDLDAELMRGFYQEEENSIDVLMLGSCNMYSSYSPIIAYDKSGITSYVYASPDQELVISYHYLKEALKTQDIKLVVLESLFLTCEPTAKREYYNRTAVDYLKPSLNKLELIRDLGAMESEYMQTVDSSAPDKLLTYAGYVFPLLRYHGRDDVTMDDVTFHFDRDDYSNIKGGRPLYRYLENDSLDFAYVNNGEKIRDVSREYFIKIQELCEKEGIEFLLVKSPNHYRWDDEATEAVHEFAKERNVTLLDFHNYEDFNVSDYSNTTGRLNVHGMKRFTEHLCEYIQQNYNIGPSDLSDANRAKWDKCVEEFYDKGESKKMLVEEGTLYRIFNEHDGIKIMWNECYDADSYTVYRRDGKDSEAIKVAEIKGQSYLDKNVEHGKGYVYYIVPNEGKLKDVASNEKYYVFVSAPEGATAINKNGTIRLDWDETGEVEEYYIMRKTWDNINFSYWDVCESTYYNNYSCEKGILYDYRIRGRIKEEDNSYYSAAEVVSAIPLTAPQITSMTSKEGSNTIKWNKLSTGNESKFEIYRSTGDINNFELYDTAKITSTSYTDKDIEKGKEYFYKIVLKKEKLDCVSYSDDSNIVGIVAK